MSIKVALAGAGAFGIKHLDGIRLIDGVEVVSLVGRERDKTQAVADQYGIGQKLTLPLLGTGKNACCALTSAWPSRLARSEPPLILPASRLDR